MIRRLHRSEFEHDVMVWTEEGEPFTKAFLEAGAQVIPCLDRSNPAKFIGNFRSILRTRGPYDLVHTHGTHFQGFVLAAASAFGVRHLVAHSHNDIRSLLRERSLPQRLYARAGYGLTRHYASLGLGVSELAAECAFGEQWKRDARYRLLYCGVDFQSFFRAPDPSLRTELGIPEGVPVVGHVGRYVAQKNHAFIVDLAAEMARRGSPVHFLLIGDGPLRPTITRAIQERGLSDRFTLVPDTTDVPRFLVSGMDSFLFPSLYEGVGLAAVEAQAAGLPAVISESVPPEVVVNAGTAQMLPLDAPISKWAETIERLPPRESSLEPGFQQLFLQSRFDVDACATKLAHAYREVVSS